MSLLGRSPNCNLCGDLDANCPACENTRAWAIARDARKQEAEQWIQKNLTQKHLGQERIIIPSTPDEFTMMVMSIMAYARQPLGEPAKPEKCERFQRIEVRKET